jgi:DNA polymerase-3 subunit delta
MPALTFDALLRGLKKGAAPPDPVYLLHGEEDVLKEETIRALLNAAVPPDNRDFNLDVRYAPDLSPESFDALVNTPPMLADRRAVVIRGLEQLGKRKTKLREQLVSYLAAPNPTTLLILVTAAGEDPDADLVRRATAVRLDALSADRVPRWLQHRATMLGLSLEPDAATLLLEAVGTDLSALSRELEKLAALTDSGEGEEKHRRAATAGDVTALVGVRRGETVYDLVDAALQRHVAQAAQLVELVLEQPGMTGVRIVSLLGTHLVGMTLAREERDRSSRRLTETIFRYMLAARPYGLRNYKEEAARWCEWSGYWTRAELTAALRTALAADTALKTSRVSDDRGIVTQLVLGFAARNQEAA